MKVYAHNGNDILIAHFPGNSRNENIDLINKFKEITFKLPDDIEIISPITQNCVADSPLDYQLRKNNYTYINPLYNRFMRWERQGKVNHILSALKQTDKKYCLIMDGNDVSILSDLTDIIDRLKSYDKKIIYNPTLFMYPHVVIEHIPNREQYGEYCHINAGCCIGERKELVKFYKHALAYIKQDSRPIDSEQYYIRKAFNDFQDTVFFDYKCKIFQCWHKMEYEIKNDDIYLLK
jgi:hypothetical protein